MGGLLGPSGGLYHRLGVELVDQGIATLRVSYRRPNDLDACCLDVAAAVQLAVGNGAERVVVFGHSFGGAVAVRVGVALPQFVAGVVTFATQSAGCEVAGALAGRPLLLFHGDRDEILPLDASAIVRDMAGSGELVVLPGDGHLLAKSGDILRERLLDVAARGAGARRVRLSRPAHDPGRAPTDRYEVRVSLASTGRRRSEARRISLRLGPVGPPSGRWTPPSGVASPGRPARRARPPRPAGTGTR